MNIALPATFSLSLAFATAFLSPFIGAKLVQAAPSLLKAAPGPSTLTFRVTARVGATGAYAGPQQTVQARVLLRGGAARIESSTDGTASVVLFAPPYVYRLLPASKAGARWKIGAAPDSNFADFDPQALLRDPSKIRVALLRGGAKKTGAGVLNGTPVEIYEARDFGRKGQRAKIWLRKSDALPLRLEASGGQLQFVASWRDYARPKSLSPTLFAVPKDFHVRQLTGRPPFSVL